MSLICHKWGESGIQWQSANWTWDECQLVEDIITHIGIDASQLMPSWLSNQPLHNPYEKKKRDKFVELLCKVKGEPAYNEKKEIREDIKITVRDVKLYLYI